MNIAKKLAKKFDLQRFAGEALNLTTGSSMSVEMKTFYNRELIELAGPNLVYNQFGDKRPIPKNGGKTIEFRKYDSLTKATTAISEGVTPTGHKLNVTNITAAISQYGDWTQLSDVLELTAIDNNVVEATKILGDQAGRTLDTITRDVLMGGTNVMYASKTVSGTLTEVLSRSNLDTTAKITLDMLIDAAAVLKTMNAPKINGSYIGIVHPYVEADIMKLDGWQNWQKYTTSEKMFEGELGKIAGIRFVESSESKIWNDNTCPVKTAAAGETAATYYGVFGTLILGANAYGVVDVEGGGLKHIVKQLGYGDDPLNQRSSVGWKAITTAVRLVEQYMIRIESCTSKSGSAAAN